METRQRNGKVKLDFGDDGEARKSLSAVDEIDGTLWLAVDEKAAMHRLVDAGDRRNFGQHRSYPLADYFALPAGPHAEVDLEGLGVDRAGKRLWIVGSHSLSRRQPGDGDDAHAAAAMLSQPPRRDANRYLLGCLQLAPDADGRLAPVAGAALPFDAGRSALGDMLAGDALIAPFLALPSKDNGLDIEGLAVDGQRVFLGLRGPVLRGTAILLQLELGEAAPGVLAAAPTAEGRPYLRHLVDLGGLGIRDLCIVGGDLMILAGPTMALPGPMRLYRWRDALAATAGSPTDHRPHLEPLLELPGDDTEDHAEGIASWGEEGRQVLVVYDKPSRRRLHDGNEVDADVFSI